jgi:hypothetical protein
LKIKQFQNQKHQVYIPMLLIRAKKSKILQNDQSQIKKNFEKNVNFEKEN